MLQHDSDSIVRYPATEDRIAFGANDPILRRVGHRGCLTLWRRRVDREIVEAHHPATAVADRLAEQPNRSQRPARPLNL